jgi:sulfur-oxidizing protein SoxY
MHNDPQTTRRSFLIRSASLAGGAGLICIFTSPGRATPEARDSAVRDVIGEAPLMHGRVVLDVPPLVENGNTVPLTISVDSPMTETDHVMAIHIFNEKNPQPYVVSARLGPRAGRAQFSTRIKLADSQQLIAIAAMSDGSFWSATADVIVTIAACVEDNP